MQEPGQQRVPSPARARPQPAAAPEDVQQPQPARVAGLAPLSPRHHPRAVVRLPLLRLPAPRAARPGRGRARRATPAQGDRALPGGRRGVRLQSLERQPRRHLATAT